MRLVRLAATLAVATLLSGCGLLGDPKGPQPNPNAAGTNQPELTSVRICVLPLPDVAPLYRALQAGYFHREGLTEMKPGNLITGSSGQGCVTKLAGGDVEIAYSSWTPFLEAISKGAVNIAFIADATRLAPNNSPIVVNPASGINNLKGLAGKRIVVTDLNTASHLLTASVLSVAGVDPKGIQWVHQSFPMIATTIKAGQAEAGYLAEPFTQMATRAGLVPVADTGRMGSPTAGFPLSGYGVQAQWAQKYPKTATAFQRALRSATEDLRDDRTELERIVPQYVKVFRVPAALTDATEPVSADEAQDVVKLVNFNLFRVGNIDLVGLRRVQDLMVRFAVNSSYTPIPDLGERILPYPPAGT